MMNLAIIWKDMGRHEGALGLVQTCFDLRQQVLGVDNTIHGVYAVNSEGMAGGGQTTTSIVVSSIIIGTRQIDSTGINLPGSFYPAVMVTPVT